MPHNLVTVWDILMKRYSLYAYFGLYVYLSSRIFILVNSLRIYPGRKIARS